MRRIAMRPKRHIVAYSFDCQSLENYSIGTMS